MACESYVTQARTFPSLFPRLSFPLRLRLLLLLFSFLRLPFRVACSYDGGYGGHRTLLSATSGTNGEQAASLLPGAFRCSLCNRDDRGQVEALDSM